ncbi:aldolase [Pelomonas sp. Root1444]|uniref:class II aldolase/adducin family protein n=1 Tax=Pelomonas sp. Root1444 TaxID=1736464 RepID=UPI000702DF8C|nr:aldolase [Pelomonas sp. Root1444]KQY80972.1 aldolase [Pelomonas sp. Root1444]
MNETQAREAICMIGESLYARGYVHATAGNISVRLDDGGFLITPTDACLGRLEPQRLARLDAEGRQLAGDRASKTITLHRAIYAATQATGHPARSVLHTHSTHTVALTLRGRPQSHDAELLPALTPYFVMKVGRVPLLPYHRPGDPAVAERVAERIAAYAARGIQLRAVMLSRLGPNVWHDDPASAAAVLEELEETARLALLAQDEVEPLGDAQVQELRDTFDASW